MKVENADTLFVLMRKSADSFISFVLRKILAEGKADRDKNKGKEKVLDYFFPLFHNSHLPFISVPTERRLQ